MARLTLGFDLLPRNNIAWIRVMLGNSPFQLRRLRWSQAGIVSVIGYVIPKPLHQLDPLNQRKRLGGVNDFGRAHASNLPRQPKLASQHLE